MIKVVVKRDGRKEPFDPEKLTLWAEWASVSGADWSGILLDTCQRLGEVATTSDIHKTLIQSCIDKEDTVHNKMAGRLYMGQIYKDCYGDVNNIPTLPEFYTDMVSLGYWDDMGYTLSDLEEYNTYINHDLDLDYSYTQIKQIVGKYSAQDRVSKTLFETPQFTFIRMALGLAQGSEDKATDIREWYDSFQKGIINAPTPNYMNLGTRSKGYASCCLYTVGDSIDSLAAGDHISYKMTAASAGIGNHLKTRSLGDPVRGGTIVSSGKIPYFRAKQAMVSANLQGGRGGSATTYITCNDPEIEDMISLRNPKTVDSKKVDGIDYSFGKHSNFISRAASNEDWPLFSYADEPELYEAMYSSDTEFFGNLLSEYEDNPLKEKRYVSARKLAKKTLQESQETGRFYEHYIDEINRHTPFKDKIYSSNLCAEVVQPTKPYQSVEDLYKEGDTGGEVSVCSLSAIIAGKLPLTFDEQGNWTQEALDSYYKAAYYALKMVDNVIEIMEYPFPNLKYTAQARRNAGVGISNLAYDLAERGLRYTSYEGKTYMHRLAELHSYSLHKASLQLAKERGVCDWAYKTKYPEGWLPIDTANTTVDSKVDATLLCDWEGLRKEIVALGGLRHSVLEAHMPVESSSLASDSTNSLYPIRGLVVIKTDGNKSTTFLAPDKERLAKAYEIAWDIPTKDMLECYAIFQKFCGQAISADLYIKRKEGSDKFSATEMFEDWLYSAQLGVKTRYYSNSQNSGDRGKKVETVGSSGCIGACTL